MKKYSSSLMLLLYLCLGMVSIFYVSEYIEMDIKDIMKQGEVLAVLVVAVPTIFVWHSDIQSKKIEADKAKTERLFKVQENLEKKYDNLLSRIDQLEIDEVLKGVSGFLYVYNLGVKIVENEYQFNHLRLEKIYLKLQQFQNEKKLSENRIRKINDLKQILIDTICLVYSKDEIKEQLEFLLDEEEFNGIDLSKLPSNLSYDQFAEKEEVQFIKCKVDISILKFLVYGRKKVRFLGCTFVDRRLIFGNKHIDKTELETLFEVGSIEIL